MLLYNKQKKNQNAKGNRILISVTVLGSAGPIRFVAYEEDLVASVVDTALKCYAREVANQHVYIKSVTENIDCCKHWDCLYKEILEASVAVHKKLVGESKEHSVKISSSQSSALTLNRTMKSFRLKKNNIIFQNGNGTKKLATKANQPNTQICSGVVRRVRARPVAGGFPPPCSVFHFASRSLPSAVALFRALVKRLLLIPVTASEVRRSLLSIQLLLESRRGGVQWIWPWSLFFRG
ncbi:unnamed protein product [Brassica oleracea]|uniref:(rape) hypothetical protein n=1 Tax=Brassica napus TaxID=3708 RepID=A0A816QPG9_BRANA|nr:unnamed protein product [Brassica napus]